MCGQNGTKGTGKPCLWLEGDTKMTKFRVGVFIWM